MCVSAFGYAQVQPTVHNSTFDKIGKSSGSDCACSGWINKSIADQGESSTLSSNDVVKLDDFESDGIYQEVAVVANNDYTLNLDYAFKKDGTTTDHIEIIILKGSSYVSGYTPLYEIPADAAQDGFGYETVASVEDTSNQIVRTLITPPGNTNTNAISTISFNTGSETSIAIFIRATTSDATAVHGDPGDDGSKNKGWLNGDSEIRMDNLALVNVTGSLSTENILASKLNIYPNPVVDFISIEADDVAITSVEVYSVVGQKVVDTQTITDNKLDVANLSSGVYLLKINADGKSLVKKFVKK